MEPIPPRTDAERDAVAALALMAANVDGLTTAERTRLSEIFDTLGGVDTARLFKGVLLGELRLEQAVAALRDPGVGAFAYEMAVGVCDADGHATQAERAFLERLAAALAVSGRDAAATLAEADALADAPFVLDEADLARPDLDRLITSRAVLAAALELLPQSLATMAIVPVQLKTVHDVGRAYGFTLDQGSIRELLAVVGVGLTGQVLEGYARKLFGGALRGLAGKAVGKLGATVAGAATTFATTYAIGRVAESYYAAGRSLDQARIRSVFQTELERGRGLFGRHQGDVQRAAATTDLGSLMRQLRL
jgi:uncharacterized protein (DUF697 family)/tellurite resistance protein